MNKHIAGTFDVTLRPAALAFEDTGLSRMAIDKQFHGELEAHSHGEMLAFRTGSSGGYVALERVSGTLCGVAGTFVLQHSGTMTRGAQSLSLTVVPDSGTGSLSGLSGAMLIDIVEGRHFYTFDYTLAQSA